jgi:hypothetical protein
VAVGAAAVAATAINPHGVRLWLFLVETVRVGRPYIEDWQPVYRLQGWSWLFWLLPLGVSVIAAIRSRGRVNPAYGAIVVFLAVTSLLVTRLDAFFMLAAVFLMAEPLAANRSERRPGPERRIGMLQPAFVVICIVAAPLIVVRAQRIEIGHPPMPEPEAAAFVARADLHGRVLVWFDWGEYVIWHFSPQLRVSIDGRRETVYSDRLVADHMAFYLGDADAVDLPSRIGADYIWLPPYAPVVATLRRHGWTPLFEGPDSVILARGATEHALQAMNARASRAFPGP